MVAAIALMVACAKPRPVDPAPANPRVKLAVLAVESDRLPVIAAAVSRSLASARVTGVDDTSISKVSLEVVQLSIECVEPSSQCYEAAARSLGADRLLFAQVAGEPREIHVTVTLFDTATPMPRTAQRVFANERDATAGIDALVGEVVR
jgi:hypothetical protein